MHCLTLGNIVFSYPFLFIYLLLLKMPVLRQGVKLLVFQNLTYYTPVSKIIITKNRKIDVYCIYLTPPPPTAYNHRCIQQQDLARNAISLSTPLLLGLRPRTPSPTPALSSHSLSAPSLILIKIKCQLQPLLQV